MFKSDVVIECHSESVIAKALEAYIIDLASRKEDATMFWESELEVALNVYAKAWATAKGYKKPEWYEAENTLDAQRIADIEKDLEAVASFISYKLPSQKEVEAELEADGFRW